MPVLEVQHIHKSYGALKAVCDVSFSIEPGEIFGLLGPNGAGKSTTINIVATLLAPDAGQVSVSGVPLSRSAAYKRRLGYVPQEVSLAEKLTARENLALIGRLYDLRGAELRRRVDETLGALGLADRADDLIRKYSGGMKRRINIAAALLHEPDLLLLDEPTAGVDPQARAYIFEIVERLAERGRAVLYTTHYMEEAQRLCRRTAIIDHGRILAAGTLGELVTGIRAGRQLVIQARELNAPEVERLSARLGHAPAAITNGEVRLTLTDGGHTLLDAVRAADEIGIRPTSIAIHEPTLEDVFLELTGRELRE